MAKFEFMVFSIIGLALRGSYYNFYLHKIKVVDLLKKLKTQMLNVGFNH